MLSLTTVSSVPDEAKNHADAYFFIYSLQIVSSIEAIIKQNVKGLINRPGSVTFLDLQIMMAAQREGHPISPSTVAQTLAIDPATVTRALKRLEDAKLIKRAKNGVDLRSILIFTTSEGDRIAHEVRHIFYESFKSLDRYYGSELNDNCKSEMLQMMSELRDRFNMMSKHKLKLDIPCQHQDISHNIHPRSLSLK